MKKNTPKTLLILCFIFTTLTAGAQVMAPDEDSTPYETCYAEGYNETRTSEDLVNPVNVGTIDDRSCYANYKETTIDNTIWGIYNITDGSNHLDAPNTLQPRIERSLARSQEVGVGSYARFTGTVRILETGKTNSSGSDGTYIMQAKGKHTGGGGSADPAICLYLAKPVYGNDGEGNSVQVSFDIYREQINYRGGSGGDGRQVVFLKNIQKNVPTDIFLEVGFRQDPNDASKRIHYSDAVIGGETFNWNIPEPEKGIESGIRYGAYRVKGGRAQIRWANTTYERKEVVHVPTTPSEGYVRLKNVATGKFLTDSGVGSVPVTMSNTSEGENKNWQFVDSGDFSNIESQSFGILRSPGAGFSGGAYVVVSTGTSAPSLDTDKTWTIHYSEANNTYRFESRNSGRFMYHEEDGTVTHIIASDTDDRSNWEAIPDGALNVSDIHLNEQIVKVYPNPSNGEFTISLKYLEGSKVQIFNLHGNMVFEKAFDNSEIQVNRNSELLSGVYVIRIISKENKVIYKKIILN